MKTRFRFIIQARLGSSRLPGKVVEDIGGISLLEHLVSRLVKICNEVCDIMLAVPENDDYLVKEAERFRIKAVRGPDENVLSRFYTASDDLKPTDYVIRLTADNPFVDMASVEKMIKKADADTPDFAYVAGLPLGMGTELIRVEALRSQQFYELKPHHREHVTTYIKENGHLYAILAYHWGPFVDDPQPPAIRLTVDEAEDLELIRKVLAHFTAKGSPYFSAADVASLYRNLPDFFSDNLHIRQRRVSEMQKEQNE